MKKMSVLLSLLFMIVVGGFFLSGQTKVTGQDDLGWKVWVKTSPCSGRNDWVSVSKENPTYGGGAGMWSNADLIIAGSGMNCVSNTSESCSFAAANAEAAIVRTSSSFSNYCCKEYSVWENSQTRQRTVVQGKFGTAGFPWRSVAGPMCCSEAEALAGVPGACSSGTGSGGGSGFGPMSQTNLQGTTLTFYRGTTPEKCQADCGANPQCKAFSLIKAGAYGPNDPPMCYLISAVTVSGPSSCCTSAVKSAGTSGGAGRIGNTGRSSTGLDLTGTWERNQDNSQRTWRYQVVLRPAGANTWEGSVTLETSSTSSDLDYYRNTWTGSLTIVDNGEVPGGIRKIRTTFRSTGGKTTQDNDATIINYRDPNRAELSSNPHYFKRKL